MKKLSLLLLLAISFSTRSQSFIGKTENEIKAFAEKNAYTLESSDSNSTFHRSTAMYGDPKLPVHYLYEFDKDNKCITYIIWTPDKSAKESIQKNIEKNSERSTGSSWVQKIDSKSYSWNYQGDDLSSSFTMQEVEH